MNIIASSVPDVNVYITAKNIKLYEKSKRKYGYHNFYFLGFKTRESGEFKAAVCANAYFFALNNINIVMIINHFKGISVAYAKIYPWQYNIDN